LPYKSFAKEIDNGEDTLWKDGCGGENIGIVGREAP